MLFKGIYVFQSGLSSNFMSCALHWPSMCHAVLCCLQVRMPEGDTVVLDDDSDSLSGGGPGSGQQYGEVVDAEFRDIR